MSKKKLRILYHMPSLNLINAGYTIYHGYKHAFMDLGHEFRPLTVDDDAARIMQQMKPDIFFTSLNYYHLRFLDLTLIKNQKKNGLRVFVNTPFWHSPLSKLRVNESTSLKNNKAYIKLIKSGDFGDVYYNICEQGDFRMEGFEKTTGYKHTTILLAADKMIKDQPYTKKFAADVSFIGTYLPEKRAFIKSYVFPLKKKYNLKLYGKDWTLWDRSMNMFHKFGQLYNIPFVRSLRHPDMTLEQERQVYRSSLVSINMHEDYQKQYKGDINERTFKIPASGGFEVVDDVPSLKKYFSLGKELIVAKDKTEWFDKIDYYVKNPEKRLPIITAGKRRVMRDHTYHNRIAQIIRMYNSL